MEQWRRREEAICILTTDLYLSFALSPVVSLSGPREKEKVAGEPNYANLLAWGMLFTADRDFA